MWEKIKSFLNQKWVKITAWIIWFVASAVLIIGGVTKADFSNAVTLIIGLISAITLLIAFITSKSKK